MRLDTSCLQMSPTPPPPPLYKAAHAWACIDDVVITVSVVVNCYSDSVSFADPHPPASTASEVPSGKLLYVKAAHANAC